MIQDDYRLNFVMTTHEDGSLWYTQERIDSWKDLLSSWWTQRSHFTCGRLSDGIVSLVMMYGGKHLFNLLNVVAFILYLFLISKYIFAHAGVREIVICLVASIAFLPNIEGTVLWTSGCCNYFWPTIALLIFLIFVRRMESSDRTSSYITIISCTSGFLCGMLHEGLGAPLSCGLLIHSVIKWRKTKTIPRAMIVTIICVGLGTLFPITAPAMWSRATGTENYILSVIGGLESLLRKAGIPILTLFWLLFKKRTLFKSLLGCLTLAFAILAFTMAHHGSWGGGYYYLSLTIMILFLGEYGQRIIENRIILTLATVALCGLTAHEYTYLHKISESHNQAINSEKPNSVCEVDCTAFGQDIPWLLAGAFPKSQADYRYNFVGKYYGQNPFYAHFRTKKRNENMYKLFETKNSNEFHIARLNNEIVLRFPKGIFFEGAIEVENKNGKSKQILIDHNLSILSKIKNFLTNRSVVRYYHEYSDGFHFVCMPTLSSDANSISFELSEKNEKGNSHTHKIFLPDS